MWTPVIPSVDNIHSTEIRKWDLGLRVKGMVLLRAGDPIVLCTIDWIGIANKGYNVSQQAPGQF